LQNLLNDIDRLENQSNEILITKTIIHNDCNPRNIAIRKNGIPAIYDWELAVIDVPQRDIVEFLSFVLPENFSKATFYAYLKEHFELYNDATWQEWLQATQYSLKVYIITRLSFYEVSSILIAYDFSKRVLQTALQMLNFLEEDV
jgi:hydroxymethylglutaryl-CoA reductase (NADPH)